VAFPILPSVDVSSPILQYVARRVPDDVVGVQATHSQRGAIGTVSRTCRGHLIHPIASNCSFESPADM